MRATVKDVARRAGVSPKTVSNVMNGIVPVSGATRAKVEQAILELDYVPNLSARGLRNGRSGVIALALPDLGTPYSAEIAHNVVEVAHEQGWIVQLEETGLDPQREHELMVRARSNLIDGLILNPVVLDESAVQVGVALPPVVLLGEVTQKLADRVFVDSVAAARDMTLALARTGRRRIAVLGTTQGRGSAAATLRRQGYEEALGILGIDRDESLLIPCERWTPQTAADALTAYLDSHPLPEALFCFTDSMAIGALSVLWKRGLRIPDDIAVAGFDDIADGRYAVPSLTTVSFDKRAIASEALRLLTERMADRAQDQRVVSIDYTIVERDSSRG
ncbi:LacI family transcriptional regulator [Arthrobacter sp. BB-1]|uniref:LacI family DNA-binding transcriptional regulator n=1 Tax=Micrococcaceae TaxID=1268 RepID=UPI0010E6E279|nr:MULTISPECIES: LacI family DNA-binding transcriptional regulator [Micrococcaceae]TNB69861.1 LacI family transcriptional regulator [Arthrobacter sp. BB-1]UEL28092.1 LacI family transcriptional regulator [Pseudarthrobacter sp. L1SW]VII97837.1 Transcriptional regulator, LacI family [Arthrobacter sp. DR-2P]